MLQGDALSIQLFIAATAISALSVAMTQAGWTNRWFIRGMFALAALLFAVTAAWPFLESRLPALLNWILQTVASSRVAWFFMGVVPALFAGTLLGKISRWKRAEPKSPVEWMSIFSAMESLARQDLIDRYQYVQQQVFDNARTALDLESRISALHTAAPAVEGARREEVVDELVRLQSEYEIVCKQSPGLVETEENCREALRMNIHHQLRDGQLVATGFLAPHAAGASETIIPKQEWRFLSLDHDGDQALGPNFEYIAVLIGKP